MKKKSTKLTIKKLIGIKDQCIRANVTKEMSQTDTILCFLYRGVDCHYSFRYQECVLIELC